MKPPSERARKLAEELGLGMISPCIQAALDEERAEALEEAATLMQSASRQANNMIEQLGIRGSGSPTVIERNVTREAAGAIRALKGGR